MSAIEGICHLSSEALAARRAQLRGGLLASVRKREARSNGVTLWFDATPELRVELDEFVAFESRCCPDLAMSIREASGSLLLEIDGVAAAAFDRFVAAPEARSAPGGWRADG